MNRDYKNFGQDAAQLIIKGRMLFYGYRVVLCPVKFKCPIITVDLHFGCYCVNVPADHRELWTEKVTWALGMIYKAVTYDAKNDPGDVTPKQ